MAGQRFRIEVAGRYHMTRPTTEKGAIFYAYSISDIDEPVTVETMEGRQVVRFTKRQ